MEKERVTIWVRILPNASQNSVLDYRDRVLPIRIAAPPTRGKANQELIKYLSHILGISKRHLTIEKGMTSKIKAIGIIGLTQKQINEQLARLGISPPD
jgi:uncharacterized protein (TIGR00251 family)